jgi:hypothetical protein
LPAGSGMARRSQSPRSTEGASGQSHLAARAPWFVETVDSGMEGDVGLHASVVVAHLPTGWDRPHVSHYDATRRDLRLAGYYPDAIPSCDANEDWWCH